jgi:hypothetical protein
MPIWLLKMFHFLGLTNLSDEQVEKYVAYKTPKTPKITSLHRSISVRTPSAKISVTTFVR